LRRKRPNKPDATEEKEALAHSEGFFFALALLLPYLCPTYIIRCRAAAD
jgi:hypothetical protein